MEKKAERAILIVQFLTAVTLLAFYLFIIFRQDTPTKGETLTAAILIATCGLLAFNWINFLHLERRRVALLKFEMELNALHDKQIENSKTLIQVVDDQAKLIERLVQKIEADKNV